MGKGRLSLVIMATPRSGTTYITHVLNACGLRTFHQVYLAPGARPTAWRYDGFYGEVSPAAYALRRFIPPGALVLHQTRNPVDSINSMCYTAHCRWDQFGPMSQSGFAQIAWDKLYLDACKGVAWDADRMRRCAQFWHVYNKRITQHIEKVGGFQYRIEDIDAELICGILDRVGVRSSPAFVEEVIATTSKTINRLDREPARVFDWGFMTRSQRAYAALQGYQDDRRSVERSI